MKPRKEWSKPISRIRNLYTVKRDRKQILISAINRAGNGSVDNRVYAEVQIEGKIMSGLLDSGACVSILGKECREIVEELGLKIIPIFSNVKTAGGQHYRIMGKVNVAIKYRNKENSILLYLCPDLE